MHDILIHGGLVIDGTGAPAARLDVAIDGARIAGLRKRSEARAALKVDAKGMVVCPGFVDIHTHSDLHLLSNPLAESKIRQGVTTELLGNCGGSAAPLIGRAREALADYARHLGVEVDWTSMDEYLLRLANLRTSVNVATLVGAETLRLGIVGPNNVPASEDQLAQMNGLLGESMLQGAFGVSSGLIYAPGCYASTEELISLASTSAVMGGFYASHIRGEGRPLVGAVREAIRIGREARSRVQISHHKACGKPNWGLVNTTLKLIEEARAEGVDVAVDVYPYTASSTTLDTILPPWAREGGREATIARLRSAEAREKIKAELPVPTDTWENVVADDGWENIVVTGFRLEKNRKFENRSVAGIAKELGRGNADTAFDLLIEENLGLWAVFHEMSEDDVKKVIGSPLAAIGSDGEAEAPYGPTAECTTHPRSYGTFPRVIRRYALDMNLVTLEEVVRRMTSWPAWRIGLQDRGLVRKGMAADVVVFDPDRIRDLATYEDSHRYPEGIEHVIVNGVVTIQHGEHTRERAGLVLRHTPNIC